MAVFDLGAERFEFVEAAEKRGDRYADAAGECVVASGRFMADEAVHAPEQFEVFEEIHGGGVFFDDHIKQVRAKYGTPRAARGSPVVRKPGISTGNQGENGSNGKQAGHGPAIRKAFCPICCKQKKRTQQKNTLHGRQWERKYFIIWQVIFD